MATTSPDNIRTPDPGDNYNLVVDLQTLANDVQAALTLRANSYKGTASSRISFTAAAAPGTLWQDTDGDGGLWKRGVSSWEAVAHGGVVLWSGSSTLASGTLSLSSPISSQPTGIVLVWSLASGEVAMSTNFIPKLQVALVPGGDYRFYMGAGASAGGGVLANVRKIIFISDTQITGNAGNATAPADTYVLRRVIGV